MQPWCSTVDGPVELRGTGDIPSAAELFALMVSFIFSEFPLL